VGGADYGSVRVGAFMGRRVIQSEAQKLLTEFSQQPPDSSSLDDVSDESLQEIYEANLALLEKEANLDYLCNIHPHRFEAQYAHLLPSDTNGKTFSERFGDHRDPVTRINLNSKYNIKAPTVHPIYENFRVKTFAALLSVANTDEQLASLGELMYQVCPLSHHPRP
jgi:L-arabinokinase